MITAIVIDVILVLLVVLCCADGYRKGFAHSFLGLAGFIIALVVAALFSQAVSGWIKDQFVEDAVENVIEENITAAFDESGSLEAGEKLFAAVDRFIFGTGQDPQPYVDQIEQQGSGAIASVSAELARAVSAPLCDTLAFLLLFLAALIAIKILTAILDGIFKLPLLKQANKLAGLLFGAVAGGLYAMLLSRILISLLPWLASTAGGIFSENLVEKTVVLKFFGAFNLFKELITGLASVIS